MKIVIAMSGGVDSSIAAALIKEEGHDVIGATMQILPSDEIEDARRVADRLKIPHYVMNFRDTFTRTIINDFCNEYNLGRTPNPCIRCNRDIKFGVLLEKARELGADVIATGHHARVERHETNGMHLLKKGIDARKDQSYFLCQLTREQLGHALFPVGSLTKNRVRQIAGEMNLPVADKPESQEICFIPDDNYAEFVRAYTHRTASPGPILDQMGNILGEHQGIMAYTVGQRRGLGIAATEPLYVTAIEPERNAVVVGSKEQTYGRQLIASSLNWIAIDCPDEQLRVRARVRYRHPEADAIITPLDNDEVHVEFDKPQMAITPGQAVVFYEGDTVLGGGTIMRQGS